MGNPHRHTAETRCPLLAAGMLTVLCALPLTARPFVTLGPSDGIALDQPRVGVEFFDGATSLGPDFYNAFLLDTGAERIVVAGPALSELESNGYQTDGVILEQGVGGFTPFDVSLPYELDFVGDAGPVVSLSSVRALSNPSADFGSFGGIVGMPGMAGRVASLDFTPFGSGDIFSAFVAVTLGMDVPAGAGHRYTVPLELVAFPIEEPDPPTTASGIPFLTAVVESPVHTRRGRFLLDTGAQISMLSEHLAFDLGLDTDGDGNFDNEATTTTEIGGVGGTLTVPILDVGTLALPTAEGTDLKWTDASVVILELDPSIDGVFGSDLLTSGWLYALLLGGEGYLQQTHLDFRDGSGERGNLAIDLTPGLDTPAPGLPAADLDADGVDDDWESLFAAGSDDPLSDGDHDGLPLLVEHALNTDPGKFDRNPLKLSRQGDGSLILRYPRNRSLPFVELILESTTEPGVVPWSPVTPIESTTLLLDGLTEQVSAMLPPPASGATCFRLRASLLP